ncbi:hypothetical protein PCANC_24340 [Puccinia coronata f. sp. avenae]|uniref:Uncharacterized protein n=1 Tax=Puccinia coronata f. sp. avenae TaxID=200324 RepID=A0A2N5TV73_9BASI|nr:hypothetical protein PCANC_24340 [Puccinia coronata f. sp. avenae]
MAHSPSKLTTTYVFIPEFTMKPDISFFHHRTLASLTIFRPTAYPNLPVFHGSGIVKSRSGSTTLSNGTEASFSFVLAHMAHDFNTSKPHVLDSKARLPFLIQSATNFTSNQHATR